MKKNVITFTQIYPEMDLEKPILASKIIPSWYKELESYVGGDKTPIDGATPATIKRCMPVFDLLNAGYIISSPVDIYVTNVDGAPYYQWAAFNAITMHPIEQAPNHPAGNGFAYPKWMNFWGIKTPPGYSTLFAQPFHRESLFTILPAIVDTDKYFAPVNFPFVLNDPNFEGMIPRGTPIAQVIPFKRESWKMEYGNDEDIAASKLLDSALSTKFFDRYKTFFRSQKDFK